MEWRKEEGTKKEGNRRRPPITMRPTAAAARRRTPTYSFYSRYHITTATPQKKQALSPPAATAHTNTRSSSTRTRHPTATGQGLGTAAAAADTKSSSSHSTRITTQQHKRHHYLDTTHTPTTHANAKAPYHQLSRQPASRSLAHTWQVGGGAKAETANQQRRNSSSSSSSSRPPRRRRTTTAESNNHYPSSTTSSSSSTAGSTYLPSNSNHNNYIHKGLQHIENSAQYTSLALRSSSSALRAAAAAAHAKKQRMRRSSINAGGRLALSSLPPPLTPTTDEPAAAEAKHTPQAKKTRTVTVHKDNTQEYTTRGLGLAGTRPRHHQPRHRVAPAVQPHTAAATTSIPAAASQKNGIAHMPTTAASTITIADDVDHLLLSRPRIGGRERERSKTERHGTMAYMAVGGGGSGGMHERRRRATDMDTASDAAHHRYAPTTSAAMATTTTITSYTTGAAGGGGQFSLRVHSSRAKEEAAARATAVAASVDTDDDDRAGRRRRRTDEDFHRVAEDRREDRDRQPHRVSPAADTPPKQKGHYQRYNIDMTPSPPKRYDAATRSSYLTNGRNGSHRRDVSGSGGDRSHHRRPYRPLVGLSNLGNTCFMNSALQCLLTIPALVDYFGGAAYIRDVNPKSVTHGRLARAFGEFVATVGGSEDYEVAQPSVLKRTVEYIAPQFAGFGQHDSQEFVSFLLSGLHDDVNLIREMPKYEEIEDREGESDDIKSDRWWHNYLDRNKSVINDVFCGQLRSVVQCQTCKHVSTAFDPFWDLSLPIPGASHSSSSSSLRRSGSSSLFGTCGGRSSMHSPSPSPRGRSTSSHRSGQGVHILDCFRAYTSEEMLTGNEKAYCSACKTHRSSTKTLAVWRFPKVLVVHLKRFHRAFSRGKLNTDVTIDHHLDLSQFAQSRQATHGGKLTYELFGVSNHMGGAGGGHYTAICDVAAAGTMDRSPHKKKKPRWFLFNDTSVREVRYEAIGGSTAYLLFYKRVAHR